MALLSTPSPAQAWLWWAGHSKIRKEEREGGGGEKEEEGEVLSP